MIFKISYPLIHLKSTSSARTFFFFIWDKSSLWIMNRTAFFSFVKMFHNFLLQLLLSMWFYKLDQFFLLIIRCISQHFGIVCCRLILIRRYVDESGRNGISMVIKLIEMTIVAGWSWLNRFVHTPREINFIFRNN